MIRFQSEETFNKFLDTMKFASQDVKVLENFIARIKYLNGYAGEVTLGYDREPHSFGVGFPTGVVGGLIYNKHTQAWGIHT